MAVESLFGQGLSEGEEIDVEPGNQQAVHLRRVRVQYKAGSFFRMMCEVFCDCDAMCNAPIDTVISLKYEIRVASHGPAPTATALELGKFMAAHAISLRC